METTFEQPSSTEVMKETLARLRQEKMDLQGRQNTAIADYMVAKKRADDLEGRLENLTNRIINLEQALRVDRSVADKRRLGKQGKVEESFS